MFYLLTQMLIWIAIAFIAGLLIGWLFWGRCCRDANNTTIPAHDSSGASANTTASTAMGSTSESTAPASEAEEPSSPPSDEARPVALSSAGEGGADDLTKIKGIGPKLNDLLNGLGIFHFSQIAELNRDNIEWLDDHLSFKGRIDREDWVAQAKILASGGSTEFSNRSD